MKIFNKTKNILIFLIILNLSAIGLYWFLSSQINKNTEMVSNSASELNIQVAKEKQLKLSRNIIDDTEADRNKLDSFFVSSDGIVSFIQEIENLADSAGLSIEIISVEVDDYVLNEKVDAVIEVLNLTLDVSGSWSGNFYFLNLLETMPHKINIGRLNLQARRDSKGRTTGWESIIGIEVLKLK